MLNRSSALMNNVIVVSSAARNDMKAVRPNDIRSLNDFNYQARVGINTHIPRTCLDVGVSKDPIILPTVTSSQANTYIIEPTKQTVMNLDKSTGLRRPIPGGLWFNETNNRAELGVAVDDTTAGIGMTGGVFCGIATLTQNNSGFAAYVPPCPSNTPKIPLALTGNECLIKCSSSCSARQPCIFETAYTISSNLPDSTSFFVMGENMLSMTMQ